MYGISRQYMFSASHRIEGHPKCGRDHGHNYLVTVSIKQKTLDTQSMIMDYAELDREVKPIIEAMDHRRLVSYANVEAKCPYAIVAQSLGHAYMFPGHQSTAENLASVLHTMIRGKLMVPSNALTVEVVETPKSSASYTGE